MPGRKPNHGLAMVSTLIASRWSDLSLRSFRLYVGPLCLFSAGLNLVCSLVLTLCEPFSLFHQIIDSLFLCGNVLHKWEILFTSLTRLCFKRNQAESRAKIWRWFCRCWMLITLLPDGILVWSNFAYVYISTLPKHWHAYKFRLADKVMPSISQAGNGQLV